MKLSDAAIYLMLTDLRGSVLPNPMNKANQHMWVFPKMGYGS